MTKPWMKSDFLWSFSRRFYPKPLKGAFLIGLFGRSWTWLGQLAQGRLQVDWGLWGIETTTLCWQSNSHWPLQYAAPPINAWHTHIHTHTHTLTNTHTNTLTHTHTNTHKHTHSVIFFFTKILLFWMWICQMFSLCVTVWMWGKLTWESPVYSVDSPVQQRAASFQNPADHCYSVPALSD